MTNATAKLTLEQADDLVREVAPEEFGACEDFEECDAAWVYFFENGTIRVSRKNNCVTIKPKR